MADRVNVQDPASPREVATLVDEAVGAVPGVVRAYRAAPVLAGGALPSEVLAHVTTVPARRVVVSIGVDERTESRGVADATAAAVRAALPDGWRDARIRVQIRRIEHRAP